MLIIESIHWSGNKTSTGGQSQPKPAANQPVVAAVLSTRIPVSHFCVLAGAAAAPLLFQEISTATVQ